MEARTRPPDGVRAAIVFPCAALDPHRFPTYTGGHPGVGGKELATTLPDGITLMVDGETVLVQGRHQCLVESKSVADTWHTVQIADDGKAECSCKGFEIRKRCRHARAVERWLADEADVRFRWDPPGEAHDA